MPTRVLTEPAKSLRPHFIKTLKDELRRCEHPNCPFPNAPRGDLIAHEGLASFGEMMGVENSRLDVLLATSPANVFVLHNSPCHIEKRPSREQCVEMLKRRSEWFWQKYGFRNAREAVVYFYGKLKELQEEGIFKQFPGLPKNLEIL